ncbi:hypothetical protein [Paenibacillus odorifer]|uniref:hypothetical protein n=1 Tax=Paenibacillus odorifer TaxID=189426 RepID=UPI0004F5D261|nr:hypothetical protein [Paenibacillus odorifer]AIQ73001.1 hypothetical protein PODO_06890 [Paenibacillus odorifer]
MAEFINVSEIIPPHSGLQICLSNNEPIKVLQWQCQSEPVADLQKGVFTTDPLFIIKAIEFIQLAKETNSDLVLTPEYSFPNEVLDTIVRTPEIWPRKGALWCLSMQGSTIKEFSEKLELWTATGRILIVKDAWERLSSRSFIDSLVYLFITDDNNLCVIPQFKTSHMSERMNEYESGRLSTSDLIYVFDLVGSSHDLNRFMSIICSDALCIEPKDILNFTVGKNLTLFHAQLNHKPRDSTFRAFRDYFLDRDHGRDIRIITLNWADGTIIDGEKFDKPWSAFYKKEQSGNIAERELRNINQNKGTFYALYRKYTEIWYSCKDEHCKLFDINKGFQPGSFYPANPRNEPITREYYSFGLEDKWNPEACNDQTYTFRALIDEHGQDYSFPMYADINDCDAFFGLCFGHFLEGELSADNDELTSRLLLGPDVESDKKRTSKVSQYNLLVKLIKKQVFPMELENLINNHFLHLDSQTAEDKWKYGNVYPKDIPFDELNPYHSALFIISEYNEKTEVARQVDDICKKLHRSFRNKVVIYYFSRETEKYEYFDEHLKQTRIDKASFSKSLSSIKGSF